MDGNGLTVTLTDALTLPQLLEEVMVYVPFCADWILDMVGFCEEELYPFGPLQLYAVAPVALELKFSDCPWQIGLGEAEAMGFDAVGE